MKGYQTPVSVGGNTPGEISQYGTSQAWVYPW